MRAAAGGALVACGVLVLVHAPQLLPGLKAVGAAGLGVLLLVGLWTPVAGVLAAFAALWAGFAEPSPHDGYYALLATLGAALALLGPGAFSIDARLFGWKRVEIGRGGNRPPFERE